MAQVQPWKEKSLLTDNSRIYVIWFLSSANCELRFSWFLAGQGILGCILDILNILFESKICLNYMKNIAFKTTNSNPLFAVCDSNVRLVFKVFAAELMIFFFFPTPGACKTAPGQGLNPHHNCDQSHSSDNAWSLDVRLKGSSSNDWICPTGEPLKSMWTWVEPLLWLSLWYAD